MTLQEAVKIYLKCDKDGKEPCDGCPLLDHKFLGDPCICSLLGAADDGAKKIGKEKV